MGQGGVVRLEFHRHRDAHGGFEPTHRFEQLRLDCKGRRSRIGRKLIKIQLNRIGSGGFEAPGEIDPGPGPAAVERGDDRDGERRLELSDLAEIPIGAQAIRRRRRARMLGEIDLLLEKRAHDDCARAGVLELPGHIGVVPER